jgi:DNA-binding NarL/FixJ family response regulator
VSKSGTLDVLLNTIRAAAQGQVTFSAAASARIVQELNSPSEPVEQLTSRELEVMECIAQGLSNKEIAWRLRVSEKTIKSHVSTILSKFGLQSRTQAALYATRIGLVPTERPAAAAAARNVVMLDTQRSTRTAFSARPAIRAAMS